MMKYLVMLLGTVMLLSSPAQACTGPTEDGKVQAPQPEQPEQPRS